jgi:hypothetical protein
MIGPKLSVNFYTKIFQMIYGDIQIFQKNYFSKYFHWSTINRNGKLNTQTTKS